MHASHKTSDMSTLLASLPTPTALPVASPYEERETAVVAVGPSASVPPYLRRKNFVPRKITDFGDGGAFPEIHVAQYPLDMGRADTARGDRTLAVAVGADGNVSHDAIVLQGANRGKIVHTGHGSVVPKLERMSAAVS